MGEEFVDIVILLNFMYNVTYDPWTNSNRLKQVVLLSKIKIIAKYKKSILELIPLIPL